MIYDPKALVNIQKGFITESEAHFFHGEALVRARSPEPTSAADGREMLAAFTFGIDQQQAVIARVGLDQTERLISRTIKLETLTKWLIGITLASVVVFVVLTAPLSIEAAKHLLYPDAVVPTPELRVIFPTPAVPPFAFQQTPKTPSPLAVV
jgi:hypothetical protein